MSHSSAAPLSPAVELPAIPLLQLGTWVVFYGLLAMLAIFFVSADQGALSLPAGNAIHEWVHDRLRSAGIAVRRADTFPGLDDTWIRIAVRPPETSDRLLRAIAAMP